ncbi:MAG: RDD family protein [Lachnospiraceae bacterium]|nr:RDD family protein [Lachnospiraceae bacterium]
MQDNTDNLVYAGFFVRLAAYITDMAIVSVILLAVRLPIWFSRIFNSQNILVRDLVFKYSFADILFYVLTATYFVLLTYFTGSTIGKKLFNIKVICVEKRKFTFFEILFRETFGRFLSKIIIYIGYIIAGADRQKRGLHDLLSDTCVVYCYGRNNYNKQPLNYNSQTLDYNSQPVNYNGQSRNYYNATDGSDIIDGGETGNINNSL